MSNVQSYNALIDRFKAFASGHFILKSFSHGQIDTADLEKFTEYPFMHVVPSNVTYAKGTKTFSFQIVLADLPRDKDDKVEFQREVLSDLQRIAEDLVAEITNHRVLFGDLITVQNVSLEPFLEEFHNTLTGWTISLDLLVPYYWDACSIPAEWNDMFESSTGGTGSILSFVDSITRDENGNVSLVNDEATPSPNYYYGTNDEGVRGWYLLTDEVGLTCATIGTCQTIIDIESAIDDLQTEILLKANTADISAVGFSNDYNDLDNKPTIPDVSGFVPYTGATSDVDLGTYNLTADHIALNVSPSGAGYVVGATQWNNTIGSSETLLKGGSVSLKNGVDLVARVVNKVTPNTTLTKAAYQAVRVSGAQGQRLAVELAQANNDNNSADTIGIVCETIATNQEGFIQTVGQLEGINTTGSLQGETWADGDVLYLSPTTAGALTNIKPTGATGHIVVIGYVEYAHANNGKIYVKVMNGWELDELHNVYITTPVNNEVLTYESSTSLWKNKTIATALGYTPVPTTRSITINGTTQDLSADRTFTIATGLTVGTTPITSGTVGRVLFEGTGNVLQESANLFWDNTNSRLGIGTASPTVPFQVETSGLVTGLFINTGNDGGFTAQNNGTLALNRTTQVRLVNGTTIFGANDRTYQLVNIGKTTTTADFYIQYWNGTSYLERFRVFATGNVAIGTTTDAGFKLDVNGTARVSGNSASGVLTVSNASNAISISMASLLAPSSGGDTYFTVGRSLSNNQSALVGHSTTGGGQYAFLVVYGRPANDFVVTGNGQVALGTSTPNASSRLTIESTTQGFLPPRMTTTQKNAIASPAAGLVVFDTTLNKLCVRGASAWETITSL